MDCKAKSPVLGAVTIENGIAYIGASDSTFRAIDIHTGKVIMKQNICELDTMIFFREALEAHEFMLLPFLFRFSRKKPMQRNNIFPRQIKPFRTEPL